jgi:hypothetical protein
MIYVGSLLGGSSTSVERIEAFIAELSLLIEDLQVGRTFDCEIDAVFHVAGPVLDVSFEGVRSGTLSRSQRIVQVQMAVPDKEWDARDLRTFLRGSLAEAVQVARGRIQAGKLDWDTSPFTDVVKAAETMPDDVDWDSDPAL